MPKSALELIPQELQRVALSEADIKRAVALAQAANDRVRDAADAHMRFEDEPASYLQLLELEADEK